uniref:Uncharacterized protein n=1 Tax=Solanum tuberosum TaxID=4113 RepID=M1A8B3_SOLTU
MIWSTNQLESGSDMLKCSCTLLSDLRIRHAAPVSSTGAELSPMFYCNKNKF